MRTQSSRSEGRGKRAIWSDESGEEMARGRVVSKSRVAAGREGSGRGVARDAERGRGPTGAACVRPPCKWNFY